MKKIIISRTDNIGDVMLSLPVAGLLKSYLGKNTEILFIGKKYTKALVEACQNIDIFLDRDKIIENPELLKETGADCIIHLFPEKEIARIAYKAKIKKRIGTSHRLFHWLYCNQRVNFSRKNSDLHEAQLNFKLLYPLGIHTIPTLQDIPSLYGFTQVKKLPENISSLLKKNSLNIIFHPKSKGSAREWPIKSYSELAEKLIKNNISVFVTGTSAEGENIRRENNELFELPNVTDLTGKLSLEELIAFINACDGLVACSTGPLHIASALGKNSLGIYPPMKPIHPGRWAPLGYHSMVLVQNKSCNDCRLNQNCKCIKDISVSQVYDVLLKWNKN